jgi:uncharacterized protein (DUF58 family)
MKETLTGDYHSAFKGSGLEFDQLRDYIYGDDSRFIDWNSSAKMNKIMIKQFIEERDRTVILAIDVSASYLYSSKYELRRDTLAFLSSTLAFIAHENKDRVGALFFTDRVEKWIAPQRGQTHLGNILETIFSLNPVGTRTDIAQALKFLVSLKKRNVIIFMISDWIDDISYYEKILKVASCKYDFVGFRIIDPCERKFPSIGLIDVYNPETRETKTLDARKALSLNNIFSSRLYEQKKLFEKYKIDFLDLTVGSPFINSLVQFFHKRIRRQV